MEELGHQSPCHCTPFTTEKWQSSLRWASQGLHYQKVGSEVWQSICSSWNPFRHFLTFKDPLSQKRRYSKPLSSLTIMINILLWRKGKLASGQHGKKLVLQEYITFGRISNRILWSTWSECPEQKQASAEFFTLFLKNGLGCSKRIISPLKNTCGLLAHTSNKE